jgi:hypothetical protein
MERQYIFFKSAAAFWLFVIGFALLWAIIAGVVFIYGASWVLPVFIILYCAGLVYHVFKIDRAGP